MPQPSHRYTQTWASMEGMVEEGKCKNIGVSNFTKEQLDHLCSVAKIPPAVNQVELHPYFQQQDLMAHCEKAGSASIASFSVS